MKRTLAIFFATAALALSLAGCADMGTGNGTAATGATDTMHDDNGTPGTGTVGGASTGTVNGNSVAGAVNRATGMGRAAREGLRDAADAAVGGPNSSVYRATNNGGVLSEREAAAAGDRYARMMQNGRVHDRDGMLLDGENTSWDTL